VRGFRDRSEAGRRLGAELATLHLERPVVLGLPRGGVPVAAQVAAALRAPLDVIVVRKLGVPWQPELAMGAVGEDGAAVINDPVVRGARVTADELEAARRRESAEVDRRAALFRGGRRRLALDGRTAVLVDDGLATGATARAAVRVARAHGARTVVVAVPVAPPDTVAALRREADDVIALMTPEDFGAVGRFYRDFTQTSDDEVVSCLAAQAPPPEDPAPGP
jgi:predicted phosphoribosyltransferase